MATLKEDYEDEYFDEPYGGVKEVFVPGIQGASVKGDKGEPFRYSDFTAAQLAGLTGPKGDTGPQGPIGQTGNNGEDGVNWFPSMNEDGTLSWTNDKGYTNPDPVNLMGEKGEKGETGSLENIPEATAADLVAGTSSSVTVSSPAAYSSAVTSIASALDASQTETIEAEITALDSSLAAVAKTGAYADLTGQPDITAAVGSAVSTLHEVARTGDYGALENIPDFASVAMSGSYNDLSNTPDLSVYLPLAGGTMTGSLAIADAEFVDIGYPWASQTGALLALRSAEHTANPGGFDLYAKNESGEYFLRGKVDGSLTWSGREVEQVTTNSTNYIRYNSGLQICWGFFTTAEIAASGVVWMTVSLPVAFSSTNFAFEAIPDTDGGSTWGLRIAGSQKTTSNISLKYVNSHTGTAGATVWSYMAVGRWK